MSPALAAWATHFRTEAFLRSPSARQRQAKAALTSSAVVDVLAAHDPRWCGTIPLGIDVESSDIDVVCVADDIDAFMQFAHQHFAQEPQFRSSTTKVREVVSAVVSFVHHGLVIEVFAQPVPSEMQLGFVHMCIEAAVLHGRGAAFADEVRALKRQGVKTEPAFAQLLGIQGDPYLGLVAWAKTAALPPPMG